MFGERRTTIILAIPLAVLLTATGLLYGFQKRQERQESGHPGFGINIAAIQQASAPEEKPPPWQPVLKEFADPHEQLRHAEELCRNGRLDQSLYAIALQELEIAYDGLYPSRTAETCLHMMARYTGLWGKGDSEAAVKIYERFLETFPESELRGLICYELGLTYELGLDDGKKGNTYLKRAVAVAPNSLGGLLAARRLEQDEG